ncbi:MAG TPA: hydroxyphenylacetyl-CoA thioesterase PaaI [Gemmatimonadaceae bacterium]|nr:hydroxyphenylacetyl-CoA thioesterase PaaI [Gemmatimonadaceae bacterium]
MSAPGQPSASEQRLAERVVQEMLDADAFSRWLGIELVEVRPRSATVRMMVRAEMTNGFGVCHGGVTFSLADSAFAFACNTSGLVTMSIENSITYPVAVAPGDLLTAVAEEEAASGRLGYYRVAVTRQDLTTVALFRGTAYRTKRPHRAAEELGVGNE